MSFFQNTCKPKGLGGKLMVRIMNSGHKVLSEWGMEGLMFDEKDAVLDIGCGGGANLKVLLKRCPGGTAAGIDYSEVSVEKSRKVNREAIRAGRCRVVQGDVLDLPFGDGEFDKATAFETVYFWPDLEKAFGQVRRVLKEGGVFLICNEACGKNPRDSKWESMIQGMKVCTGEELESILYQAGFSEVRRREKENGWIRLTAKK